ANATREFCKISRLRRNVNELAAIIPIKSLSRTRDFKQIKITIAVIVKQQHSPAELFKQGISEGPVLAFWKHLARDIFKSNVRCFLINEIGLIPCRRDGIRVPTLFKVIVSQRASTAALA